MKLFCSCPKGLEGLLSEELIALNLSEVKMTSYGVSCEGDIAQIYEICLWSRLSNRVFLQLNRFGCETADELYQGVLEIDWLSHMAEEASFVVDFSGGNQGINNTAFGAQKVKDAIVDQIREKTGTRPNIQANRPDIRVNVHLRKTMATVSIDMSGESLHMRGYRTEAGVAPLKENLAAAILKRAGLDGYTSRAGEKSIAVIDPMCGSGTLLIEAAMVLSDRAPGLNRDYFGFFGWKQFDADLWGGLKDSAFDRFDKGKDNLGVEFFGYDWSASTLDTARRNAERAELADCLTFIKQPLKALQKPKHASEGLIVCNPPYGARIGQFDEIRPVYQELGDAAQEFLGSIGDEDISLDVTEEGKDSASAWRMAVFTGNTELFSATRWKYKKKYKLVNGTIPCELFLVDVVQDSLKEEATLMRNRGRNWLIKHPERAAMFANRLKKNRKTIAKWAAKEKVYCYRLYDADMPEYSMAIDIYNDWVHVQEYVAPKTIPVEMAQERFLEALAVIRDELGIDSKKIIYKRRRRQSGDSQYEKVAEVSQKFEVEEYGVKVLVNLTDYLDTGLFLDHRPVRKWIQENSFGKRFLNLFCYTGVGTMHAVKGGAKSSTSVDMSKTYLAWAEENLQLNGFSSEGHRFERENVVEWLKRSREGYDLIFLDPPSFSNSKKMQGVFDVQRDHVFLIKECMRLLAPQGTLIFSNNFRKFVLDEEVLEAYQVEDIHRKTIDPDFKRNAGIHHCWLITAK